MGEITWTDTSVEHLRSIYEYISNDSKVYATRYIQSLIGATRKLRMLPYCGRVVPELENPALREIIYRNHRIVYSVSEKDGEIRVLGVIHGARDMAMERINQNHW